MTRASLPTRYVVDASVALKVAWREVHTDSAYRLMAAAEKGWAHLIAPDFWIAECANGCWKRVQRGKNTPEEAVRALAALRALPIANIDSAELHDTILPIALAQRTSCYDALYVATAQFADVPLVTADTSLVQMLKDAAWKGSVFHISQW